MNRELLSAWIAEGRSLNEIAALTGRDPSTVGYWVSKHRLVANGRRKYAPRGALERDELIPLVEKRLTLQQMAQKLDRSTSTVRHWLRKYGLSTKRRHRRSAALEAVSSGETKFSGTCRHHGPTQFLVWADGRSRCARCNSEAVARRRRKVKETLVAEAGGCCAICGYDRYIGALQFHHLYPMDKQFPLSRRGVTIAIDRSRQEAKKCVLLCANCHAEVEGGVASLPN